ncbi:MAG: hypothetical protein QMB37_07560 [Paludibacteraceae bacterium]
MKKCLTATATKGVFKQNAIHPEIFDLQTDEGNNFPFTYFRLSSPRSEFLIKQRAVYVAESHRNGEKVLFTGLRQTIARGIYSGNMLNPKTQKRSLLLFEENKPQKIFIVYVFPNHNPTKIQPIINDLLGIK